MFSALISDIKSENILIDVRENVRIADFGSSHMAALFETQHHTLFYAAWCTGPNRTHKQFPVFKRFPPIFGDLVFGLLDPRPSSRYGFREVSVHETCKWEFFDVYSRALKRLEVPESPPDLRCGQETAQVWQRMAPWEHPRVPNIDGFKPV
ncbi:hypothetical protein P692DRAFT_20948884 [Suillus brevipes Sb2]|nr:hypothetical protein P692DRAFT_20948884 [Suillus brevipes Sb2]